MDREEILSELKEAEAILQGHFILSSGLHSDTYIQCARVFMDAMRGEKLCAALAKKVQETLAGQQIDLVVAPAMGGVVIGYEMGRQLGVPSIFCERVDGEFTFRRGFSFEKDTNILIVEDVVTTGKSSLETVDAIQAQGGNVVGEACLIDRRGAEAQELGFPLVPLISFDVKTFQPNDVPDNLQSVPAIKPGSRWLQK